MMGELLKNVTPILFLIVFGNILRKINYFEEVAIQRLTSMVANLVIPCVIFTTFINLKLEREHLLLAFSFAVLQCLLLLVSWFIYKAFKIKRRFFPFFSCVFAFGFMAVPLFSTVFGEDHMAFLVAIGVGHELFVGIIYLTTAKLYLKNEKSNLKNMSKSLLSPLFIMIFISLFLKATGLDILARENWITSGLLTAIAKIASMTTTLTMIIVGYRIRFNNPNRILESVGYVAFRYTLIFSLGYLFKALVFDRIAPQNIYLDYALFTMFSQHGSVVLNAFVGEYGTQEDLEVASNAFVINALVGIGLYVIFIFKISLLG